MTSKDRLRELIDRLPEEQAEELLRVATDLFAVPEQRRRLPAFVGVGDSGRTDVSGRADDYLGEGFGRWRRPVIVVDTGVLYALADRRDALGHRSWSRHR